MSRVLMVYCYRGQLSCSNLYAQTHIEPRSYLYGAFERHHLQQTPYSKHHESSCFRRKYFQSKQLKNLFILFTSSAVFIEESFCVLPFTYLFINFTLFSYYYKWSIFLLSFYMFLLFPRDLACGLPIHTKFDDLDLISWSQVCRNHKLQIVSRFLWFKRCIVDSLHRSSTVCFVWLVYLRK